MPDSDEGWKQYLRNRGLEDRFIGWDNDMKQAKEKRGANPKASLGARLKGGVASTLRELADGLEEEDFDERIDVWVDPNSGSIVVVIPQDKPQQDKPQQVI